MILTNEKFASGKRDIERDGYISYDVLRKSARMDYRMSIWRGSPGFL